MTSDTPLGDLTAGHLQEMLRRAALPKLMRPSHVAREYGGRSRAWVIRECKRLKIPARDEHCRRRSKGSLGWSSQKEKFILRRDWELAQEPTTENQPPANQSAPAP